MPMYVLVEFDSDTQAKKFCDKLENKTFFRVIGLFKKPHKFCECGPILDSQTANELTRGTNFGWIVHRRCRRARKAAQSPRNLLEGTDIPANKRNFFLHLTPNYPLTVHNVSPRS